jgi:hypothetical protein
LDTELRLAIVQALINEAEAGRLEEDHLKQVALIFVGPR